MGVMNASLGSGFEESLVIGRSVLAVYSMYTAYMSWAARRRFIILLIIGAVGVSFLAIILIATFYTSPSCSDGAQNQGEAGIDCGGPCSFLCIDQQRSPTVLFTKAISNGAGRTDVVASVENVNATSVAKNVPYTVTLYGPGQIFVQQVTGVLDLPPSSTIPIFIPGISTGNQKITNVFLTIDPSVLKWFTMTNAMSTIPVIKNTTLGGTATAPRIDAVLSNANITLLENVRVVVLVHNSQGEVIAASETIVPNIPAQGQASATFTWNNAFIDVPATIEVIPIRQLP